MEKIKALEDAIQKNNLAGIYSVFYTIAHGDPNFSTGKFEETLEYVKSKKIAGFMKEFDGDELEPETKWDEDYWAYIASSLLDNFCMTRIEHLKQVGRKVYPIKVNQMSTQGVNANNIQRGSRQPINSGLGMNQSINHGRINTEQSQRRGTHMRDDRNYSRNNHQYSEQSFFDKFLKVVADGMINIGNDLNNHIDNQGEKR